MLMNSKWSDSRQEVIELQEAQQCIEVFPYFLRYFYTGVISLSPTNIIPLLVLADKYNVKVLNTYNRLILSKNIPVIIIYLMYYRI